MPLTQWNMKTQSMCWLLKQTPSQKCFCLDHQEKSSLLWFPHYFPSYSGAPWPPKLLKWGGSVLLISLSHAYSLDLNPKEKFYLHHLFHLTLVQTSTGPPWSTFFPRLDFRNRSRSDRRQARALAIMQEYNDVSVWSTGCQTAASKYPDVWQHVKQNLDSLGKYFIAV